MARTAAVVTTIALACLVVGSASAEPRRGAAGARRALPTKRIDIAFHDADIRNVLRFFAEIGRINIVYGEEVQGRVTVSLKRVRWDRALRAILRTKGLDMEWDDNIIRVAKAETFERERQSEIDQRQSCLKTARLDTRVLRVSHARAADLAPLVEANLQSDRGSVTVDERTNSLIVRDTSCPR